MFEYIKGTLTESSPVRITLETNGVGYCLLISLSTYAKLPKIGETLCCFVSFVVREDSQRLFGFLSREERTLFEKLNEVSGIGPKTALSLLGHLDVQQLAAAVQTNDTKALTRVPGIGQKTAERLVIELRDKFKNISLTKPTKQQIAFDDAVSALVHLGYNIKDAQNAVKNSLDKAGKEPSLSEIITSVLKSR
ncbi:MAG TPA: Holliday junction branch migration protein RuvA [Rhabdochlamydiaceae bacterium]|nr:Holliday junction branch migration protein RuvA [Rhabdochlamydiaceae bacterium]